MAQPINVYDAADGPFMMAVVTQGQFVKLCNDVIEQPQWLADDRFAKNPARLANEAMLREMLNEIFATRGRADWVERLRKAGVPAGVVATIAEAFASNLVTEREAVREVRHRDVGPYRALKTPARLHDTQPLPPIGAPALGEHTREVLRDIGGLTEAEIDALIAAGVAA